VNRYRLMRFERGLTLDQLSEATGVSPRTLLRLERDQTMPAATTAKALADFYGLTVAELLGLEPIANGEAA
jgi:transcriptional regulator with XRE-family HTH domain